MARKKKSKASPGGGTPSKQQQQQATVEYLDLRYKFSSGKSVKLAVADAKSLQLANGERVLIHNSPHTLAVLPVEKIIDTKKLAPGFCHVPQFVSLSSSSDPYATPTKGTNSHSVSTIRILPLHSDLGQRALSVLAHDCTEIVIEPERPVAVKYLQALILATFAGRYIADTQPHLSLSVAGKPLTCKVQSIVGAADYDDVPTHQQQRLDDPFLRELQTNPTRLYQLSQSTTIICVPAGTPRETVPSPNEPLVAGLDDTLHHIQQLLDYRGFRGILVHGPSGVGKTSAMRQLAQQRGGTFLSARHILGKTSIVGEAERYLKRLLEAAEVLMLDDMDLIGSRRGSVSSTDQLTATLLALLDGVERRNCTVIGITRNPSALDPALRRPGRFDTEVEIPNPDEATVKAQIMEFHLRRLKQPTDGVLAAAKLAKGFNGADCLLAVKAGIRAALLAEEPLGPHHLKQGIRTTQPSAIKSITVEIPQVRWDDIGGMESVKQSLQEALALTDVDQAGPSKPQIPVPRGILLYGPPGCSKTLMARALATEGNRNFLAVKGPELLSKWLGESERALASLFRRARLASPSIIFLDELDAIAGHRGAASSTGRLVSQLLTELDGIRNQDDQLLVIGATNRPDLLDKALTRPGRMDRQIYVGLPDRATVIQILELQLRHKSRDTMHIPDIARACTGCSGAEIVAICRDAALFALEEEDNVSAVPKITAQHLLTAASNMVRQITPSMLQFYNQYRQ